MADVELTKQVGSIKAVLESIEAQVARGRVPAETLGQIKTSVDEVRLRLWAIMSAASTGEYESFVQRFRLRRATEVCRDLAKDIRAGKAGTNHAEFTALGEAARDLLTSLPKEG